MNVKNIVAIGAILVGTVTTINVIRINQFKRYIRASEDYASGKIGYMPDYQKASTKVLIAIKSFVDAIIFANIDDSFNYDRLNEMKSKLTTELFKRGVASA